jgi:hypothetical protein
MNRFIDSVALRGGFSPLENFVGKNIKGETKGKIGRSLPTPGNFVVKKSLTPPRILEILRVSPPWREVVWASLFINQNYLL